MSFRVPHESQRAFPVHHTFVPRPAAHGQQKGGAIPTGMPIGVAAAPCCAECAQTGGSCSDSTPTVRPIPGDQSFPVGFGRGVGQSATAIADTAEAWAVPLTVGLISVAAGFGLAYVIAGRR
jgi:hypothetical protein